MEHHLTQFARQLALWTEEIIDYGRTPFRRVDVFPQVETELGAINPPLVFWINRQSMMAGGILLLPDNNLEEELKRGCACASALGLRHFVTWEREQVRIWQVENDGATEHQSFPLDDPDNLESFRYLLADLLNALKLLAVLGAIPAAELSHWYLTNLFQTTLQQALPPLIEAYRGQRSEIEEHSPEDADICANEASRMLLLQVLALLWFDKFPEAILPEKMERAIEISLPELPESPRETLSLKTTIKPPPLPLETAVSFHHLLLRLRQLAWKQTPERAKQSLFSLKQSWYRNVEQNGTSAKIQLYPAAPLLDDTKIILSNSLSLLGTTSLLTAISRQHPRKLLFGNLFQLDQSMLKAGSVSARLLNETGIPSTKRRELTTRLRAAWPNRHLKIKTGQPYWFWELTHLLGILNTNQNFSFELPLDILKDPGNHQVWSLLWQHCTIQKVRQVEPSILHITGYSGKTLHHTLTVQSETETRELHPGEDAAVSRSQLLLALTLPDTIYALLGHELIWPQEESDHSQSQEIYHNSSLYKWFQTILNTETAEGVPELEPSLLKELNNVTSTDSPIEALDLTLSKVLNCPAVAKITIPEHTPEEKSPSGDVTAGKKLREKLVQQLATHGIPNFPEQYLYFLDHPEICHYSIDLPLELKSRMLGQFELQDGKGQLINGYGEELEQALLLCSAAGREEFDLPEDRRQLGELLDYYKKDLNSLYKYLKNLCYSQLENSKTARQVIKSTWKKLSLPDPTWFKQ